MSSYLGDFRTGKVIRKAWNSNAIAGESITRATNGTISVYKDGGTTQSTTGVTDTEDWDSLTGVHLVAVDTSADGTFYSAGSDFEVVLSAATIDGKTINATLFSFSLENRSALMPTTDGRKADVSAGGEMGIDWANIGSPTTTVNLSGTTVKTATDVETDTADIQGRLPAALIGGRIDANVGAISSDATAADNCEAFFDGTGYAGTGNTIPTVTTVNGLAANTVTASALAADAVAEIQSGLSTLTQAQVQTECEDALQTYHLDHLIASADPGGVVANNSFLAKLVSKSATAAFSDYDNTTDSLQALRDRGDAGWTTATGFSTHSASDVWSVTTRILTAATNITSTGGTTVPQTGDSFARIGAAGASLTDLGGMSTTMKAQVNAEVVDTLATDTYAELGQGTPAATNSLANMIRYLFKGWRNKKTQTSSQFSLFADDTTTVDQKATVSDDGTTTTIGEIATGP